MNPISLLIVEDNPVYAEILQRLLPTLGSDLRFASHWVDTAEKALEVIRQTSFEVVLLDYKLPGADGLAVLTYIRSLPQDKQPAVIMLTGMGREEVAVEAMKKGAKDYLPKDCLDVPSLLRAITSALERKRLEEQLARSTEELRQKNVQMQADLNLAREIQEAFLPQAFPCFPANAGLKESALRFYKRYLPTREVGGDFFDILPVSDTEAGVFVCDVMGHGVRAALVTAIMRALVEELKPIGADPGKLLTGINRGLVSILKQTRLPMFVSAFYLVADVGRGEIRFANAGHPAPIHVRRQLNVVEPIRAGDLRPGPALGVFDDSAYPSASRPWETQDLVLVFTDGLFEVHNSHDEQFGQERLLESVRGRAHLLPEEIFDGVLHDIQQFASGKSFNDDVCIVGVEAARRLA